MKKVLVQSVIAATAFSTILSSDKPKLEQFSQSFALNVTIQNYMPLVMMGAGVNTSISTNHSNQQPMLISLVGPATWVWSNNCTSYVTGVNASCSASPVGVSPAFNNNTQTVASFNQTY